MSEDTAPSALKRVVQAYADSEARIGKLKTALQQSKDRNRLLRRELAEAMAEPSARKRVEDFRAAREKWEMMREELRKVLPI